MIQPFLGTIFSEEKTSSSPLSVSTIADSALPDESESKLESSLGTIKRKVSQTYNSKMISDNRLKTLANFCLFLIIVMILKNFFIYLENVFSSFFLQSIINDIRKELFRKIQNLPLAFFHRNKVGELVSRVTNDVTKIQDTVAVSFVELLQDPFQIICFSFMLLIINWKLTLYILIMAPVLTLATGIIGRKLRKYSTRTQDKMAKITTILQENFSGVRLVKGFNRENFEIDRFERESDNLLSAQLKMLRVNRLASPFNEAVATSVAALLLWFGGKDVIQTGTLPLRLLFNTLYFFF
jgi:subfamily B ATP-binding cassette protein MsbA